uniref:Uncharacterized protein n=1 Tax=viral metagenome TaxID=1070528 RepID=A0A6C0BSD0_9ZZZZ
MSSNLSIILKTFNTQFEGFLDEITEIFPSNVSLLTTKNSLLTLKKFNPKLLISVWYRYIWQPYKNDILGGDINFFIDKDYTSDLKNMDESSKIISEIDNFRTPIRNMDKHNQDCCMKYIVNLSKLSEAYHSSL